MTGVLSRQELLSSASKLIAGVPATARQLGSLGDPRNLARLYSAGAINPRTMAALGATVPWLMVQGPSLATALKVNSLARPKKAALTDRAGALTWHELAGRVNRLSRVLEEIAPPAGSMAMVLRNGRELSECILAAQQLGMRACPLNTFATQREMADLIANSRPSVIFCDERHLDVVEASAADAMVVTVGPSGSYEALLARKSALPLPPKLGRSSPRLVIHTSGTTGKPKGASRDPASAGASALAALLEIVPFHSDDAIFCPAPMFHSFGLAVFSVATVLGAHIVMPDRFEPLECLDMMKGHATTAAAFIPVMLGRILDLPEERLRTVRPRKMRLLLSSGSFLPQGLRQRAANYFGDVLYDLYGSTEAGWVSIASPEDMRTKPDSLGRIVPGVEVKVLGPGGEEVKPGDIGRIAVKSDVTFEGYTGTNDAAPNDVISIGDFGRIEDGYLYLHGRTDDMAVIGGENVYPVEIEAVLERLEGVDEAAVIALHDEEYGQVLKAFYAGSLSEKEVIEGAKRALSSYKVPRSAVRLEELPRNATGKVVKAALPRN